MRSCACAPRKRRAPDARKKSSLPVTCLSLFPGTTPFTARKCFISLTPSCFPEPRFLRQHSFFPFTMEVSRPRTHSPTCPHGGCKHQDRTRTDACLLHPSAVLSLIRR